MGDEAEVTPVEDISKGEKKKGGVTRKIPHGQKAKKPSYGNDDDDLELEEDLENGPI